VWFEIPKTQCGEVYHRLSERFRDRENLEGWIGRHMRKWFRLRWHNGKGRANAFRRRKARPCNYRLAHSGRGAWRMAGMLNVILGNRRLREDEFRVPSDLVKAGTVPT